MTKVDEKVALVTGASSGIGEGICRALVDHGYVVVGAARRLDRLKKLEDEFNGKALTSGKFHPVECDLTNEDQVLLVFSHIENKYNKIDVVVSNAGVSKGNPLMSGKTAVWNEMLQVNVLATAIICREATRLMRPGGNIVLIGSHLGHYVPPANLMHFYSATKFAVRALADGLRQELVQAQSDIRVSHISPGPVRTEASLGMFPHMPNINDILFANFKPLEPSEVATAVLYVVTAPPNVNVNEVIINPIQGESIPRPKELTHPAKESKG